jgi:CspA family cold shock protein
MSEATQSVVCQRCGRGFIVTTSFRDFLARRGRHVKVPVVCMTCFLRKGPVRKQQGEVKWFNPNKHFGFVLSEEGQDVFLHQNHFLEDNGKALQAGQKVRFHLHQAPRGPEAWNVELA